MTDEALGRALDATREIDVTTVGRRTGGPVTFPIWFVRRDDTLLLLPLRGSDTGWYQNLLDDPTITVVADGVEHAATAVPITDAQAVAGVVEAFRQKYGADDVRAYYPKTDVAVRVPLG
jgi:deazaflavin-dependent oxidoreductase (nitroreductase family)